MKALIFGGVGQLGRALKAKAGDDWKMEAIDLPECDITDDAATKAMIADSDCDMVINAAAYIAVDKAESELEITQTVEWYLQNEDWWQALMERRI
tara:strand:- start:770 stop:1054 length:285 start_codon:yes stop_codon:yes gene_type:complete